MTNKIMQKWKFRITPVRTILLLMTLVFLALAGFRLVRGLGESTNLNDQWPWGLWIGVDLAAIALAGVGYSMSLLAHVLKIRDFESVSRKATLISFLSYIFVLGTLILEIGRWDNAFRPLISWGYHSPMFEVFIAISLYMIIQLAELAEIITEKIYQPLNQFIRRFLPIAFILGAIIPFGHQASLGGLYLTMIGKLHPLWWSPNLPWFFLLTSFYVGQSVLILNVLFSKRDQTRSIAILEKLVLISLPLMGIYAIWKVVDLVVLDNWKLGLSFSLEAVMLWAEMAIGVFLPICIGFSPWRKKVGGLCLFSSLSILGVILGRINVVYTGMIQALGNTYAPSWIEWGITLGLLSFMTWLYLFLVDNFEFCGKKKSDASQDTALAA